MWPSPSVSPQYTTPRAHPSAFRPAQMLNHGADVEGVTCLLLGSMSYEGFDVTKLKPLAGALRAVLKQGPADVGGPITEALALACGSTVERVLQLEQSLLLQRRCGGRRLGVGGGE